MKFTYTALLASAVAGVFAIPTPTEQGPITARQAASACATAVTLSGNPFAGRSIYANKFYSSEVLSAAASITDSALKAKATKVASVGTYLWLSVFELLLKDWTDKLQ
jgi:cellulose 1,4-beta-cellobiosidase